MVIASRTLTKTFDSLESICNNGSRTDNNYNLIEIFECIVTHGQAGGRLSALHVGTYPL